MSNLNLGDEVTGSYRLASDSKHLAADDLNTDGKPISLTIEKGVFEEVISPGNRKKSMLCLHFIGATKALAVNATNAKAITQILGTNQVSEWKGKKVSLFRTTIKAFGNDNMPCIRVCK